MPEIHPPLANPTSLAQPHELERLTWELRKLKAETSNLERPWWRQHPFWLSVGTLTALLVGSVYQWTLATLQAERAEVKVARVEVDVGNAQRRLQDLETELRHRTGALQKAEIELQAHLRAIESVRAETEAVRTYKAQLSVDMARLMNGAAKSLAHVTSGLMWGNATADEPSASGGAASKPAR